MDTALFLTLFLFAVQTAAGVAPMRWPQCAWLAGLVFWASFFFAIVCLVWWGIQNREMIMPLLEPRNFIILGLLIVVAAFSYQQIRPTQTVKAGTDTTLGAGATTPETAPTDTEKWTDEARLTLTFDGELTAAMPSKQDGVRWYYWLPMPAIRVDFEKKQISNIPGQMLVFMSLHHPTHTNYNRVRVVGGGIAASVMSASSAGALVQALGDMRGRTIEIRFSKTPIPLD